MPNGILIVIEIEHLRGTINVTAIGHPVDSICRHGTGSGMRPALWTESSGRYRARIS
jgi:hypothetical protein